MPGRMIADRYELEQPLGGGAMSAVWLARDHELERKVAVKLLAHDADRTRFEREARAVAALSHPNICQLYDYGETDDGPYMILEYLPGGTLEDRLASGKPLPDGETARIARGVAAGLAHAHERRLVHRDLKPANILFDAEDRAKIADFGIARIAGAGVLTQAGTVMGTAAYISPEQAAGEPATPASDVYSFGAILYRMLTGRTPFVSDSAMELVHMHREAEPEPVEHVRADAPAALAAVAFAALAKDPADRPQDGDALLGELTADGAGDATTLLAGGAAPTAMLADPPGAAPPTQVIRPQPRRFPRRGTLLPLAIAALALAAAAGVGAAYVLTGGGGGGDDNGGPSPSLTLPTLPPDATSTERTEPTTTLEETEPATTAETTTEQTTTAETTSSTRETTTQQTSTRETTTTTTPTTTTAPPPPPPPPPTTAETTTTVTTTTAATTTAPTTAAAA